MNDYYTLLEISRDAKEEEIKKGFRKQALKYHPDKAGNSIEAAEMYERCNKAYQVLLDPNQRLIYDKYGEAGLATFAQMGEFAPFMDPSSLPAINWLLFSLSMGICCFIAAPALLAAKIDNNFSTYTAALSPIFFIDLLIYVGLIFSMIVGTLQFEGESRSELLRNLAFKFLAFLYFGLLGAFEILLAIHLDQFLDISWWAVFTPLLLWEGFNFILILIPTLFQCIENVFEQEGQEGRRHTLSEVIFIVFSNYYTFTFRFIQTIAIIYKVCSGSSANWAIVFLPLWIFGFLEFVKLFAIYFLSRNSPSGWGAQLFIFTFFGSLGFSFAGLLVSRLNSENNSPPVAIMLIPIFISLGIFLCCFSCVLPCALSAQKQQFDEEMMEMATRDDQDQPRTIVAVDHRIENSSVGAQNRNCEVQ